MKVPEEKSRDHQTTFDSYDSSFGNHEYPAQIWHQSILKMLRYFTGQVKSLTC